MFELNSLFHTVNKRQHRAGIIALCALPLLFSPAVALANQTASGQNVGKSSSTAPTADTVPVVIAGKSVVSASRIVAIDVNSHKDTSFMPGFTVESVLRSLGMDAHFVPGINQLVINMPAGYTLPDSVHRIVYRTPGPNEFAILVNAKTLAYQPAKSVGGNTYVPVYYVMKTLDALGVHSTWNGRQWSLSGKVSVPADNRMTGPLSGTFTLQLQNQNPPDGIGLPLAVPPLPPASVKLPMNALLKPTTQPFSGANEDTAAQAYVETGRATYTAFAPISAVEGWFNRAYSAQGFSQTGGGSSGNFKTGEYSESIVYTPVVQQKGQQESVAMSFKALGVSETEVEYYVTNIAIPPRPVSTDLQDGAVSMTVSETSQTYGTNTPSQPTTSTVTLTDSQTIQKVIDAVNGLTEIDAPGISSSPMYQQISNVKVVLNYANGQSVTVLAEKHDSTYGDVVISNLALKDSQGTVFTSIMKAIGK